MSKVEEKTYIIDCENGSRRKVTVPASWKVTFGPCVKGMNSGDRDHRKVPMALRFYESETKQRAIFTDVVSFRDTSIKIQEEKIRVSEKDGYMECEGVRKRTSFQASVREWVDPDVITERPLLPKDSEIFEVEDK
jgi:hypothetical protein